jgi:hypothetical protein
VLIGAGTAYMERAAPTSDDSGHWVIRWDAETLTFDAADGAGGTVTIDGDHTTEFAAGVDFNAVGSTGNDGGYTVAAVELAGGDTVITVEADQTIADATADGQIHRGELGLDNDSIATGQTVSITSFSYRALRS